MEIRLFSGRVGNALDLFKKTSPKAEKRKASFKRGRDFALVSPAAKGRRKGVKRVFRSVVRL